MNPKIRLALWTAAAIGNLVLTSRASYYFGQKFVCAIADLIDY